MLKSLKVENFKRFKELTVPKMKRVNLIAGKNNTGKTGILEALLLLLSTDSGFFNTLPNAFRNCSNIGNMKENYWKWLFHDRNMNQPVIISSETDDYPNYSVALNLGGPPQGYVVKVNLEGMTFSVLPQSSKKANVHSPNPPTNLGCVALSVHATDPQKDATEYDRVVLKAGGEERLEKLLGKLEPRLKSIRSIKPHGASLIYVDIGLREKIPAIHLGQGFLRLLSIYSELIASGKQVLLIDEVENGLHHSVLTEIWRGLLHAAEQENVQIFATTHSYECIRAAHEAFAETLNYDFALHRLEEVKDKIVVTTYDKETLETSLLSNFETR